MQNHIKLLTGVCLSSLNIGNDKSKHIIIAENSLDQHIKNFVADMCNITWKDKNPDELIKLGTHAHHNKHYYAICFKDVKTFSTQIEEIISTLHINDVDATLDTDSISDIEKIKKILF